MSLPDLIPGHLWDAWGLSSSTREDENDPDEEDKWIYLIL